LGIKGVGGAGGGEARVEKGNTGGGKKP